MTFLETEEVTETGSDLVHLNREQIPLTRIPTLVDIDLSDQLPDFPELNRIGMIQVKTGLFVSKTDHIHKLILEAMKDPRFKLIIAPEFSYQNKHKYLTSEAHQSYLSELIDSSKESSSLIIPGSMRWKDISYHASYAIHNGEVLIEQFKGYPEVPLYSFEHKGYNAGIEICSDSGSFALKGERNLDVLLTVSCGLFPLPTENAMSNNNFAIVSRVLGHDALRPGGIGIVNDGYLRGHLIYRKIQDGEIEILHSNFPSLETK
tara:strand:- start:5345 stop:6130 length:786 start_codon:yes stop_codon:yes gene_type:complete